jgi:hypothetical protein
MIWIENEIDVDGDGVFDGDGSLRRRWFDENGWLLMNLYEL